MGIGCPADESAKPLCGARSECSNRDAIIPFAVRPGSEKRASSIYLQFPYATLCYSC